MTQNGSDRRRALLNKLVQQGWGEETAILWLRAKGRCEYCGRDLQSHPDDLYHGNHIDHIVPLSRGGSDGLDNRAIACPACNRIKRAFDPRAAGQDYSRAELIARARTHIVAIRTRDWQRLREAVALLTDIESCGEDAEI